MFYLKGGVNRIEIYGLLSYAIQ